MSDAPMGTVLRHVRQLARAKAGREPSDPELLQAFARAHDQGAFAALVSRHGAMVLSVCRRVLGQEQDAEDAFQATFLVLARKASSVRKQYALAAWLHGAAYRLALSMKRSAARRRAHEARAHTMPPKTPPNDLAWREVQALLDEEVQALPEKYRVVFVLCCLEGRGRAEAAGLLGLKEGTVSSRLDHARKQLRQRLERRGVTLAALLSAAALLPAAGAAVPRALLDSTVRAAGPGGAVSASVTRLVERGLGTLFPAPLKLAALALALALLAGGAALAARAALAPRPPGPGPTALAAPPADRPAAERPPADRHGDALPPGAVVRLGTVRFRHGSTVTRVTFPPGGKRLVSAGYDGTVRVWDVATRRELLRLSPLAGSFHDLSLTADGKTLAAVDVSNSAYLGDLSTGRLKRVVLEPIEGHSCVALAPDGKTLAAGCWNLGAGTYTVRLWERGSTKPLRECPGHKGKVNCLVFSPDGKTLVTGGDDGTLRFWEVATGKEKRRLSGKKPVRAATFSRGGRLLAYGGDDGKLRLWDVRAGRQIHELGEHFNGAAALAFSPDAKLVASSGPGGWINVWDVASGKQRHRLPGGACGLSFSPDGRTLASGSHDCMVRLWDVKTGKEQPPPPDAHQGAVWWAAFSRDGKVLATAGNDRTIRLWDATTGRQRRQLDSPDAWLSPMALSPDGKVVASREFLWDSATGKLLRKFPPQRYGVKAMAFSPDGKTLATGSDDPNPAKEGRIHLWDVATARQVRHFGDRHVHSLAYSPDGRTLAAGNADGTVVLWDPAAGRERRRLRGHTREVRALAYSPGGALLASGSFDGVLLLWDADSGKQLARLGQDRRAGHRIVNLLGLAFSPNGKALASAETHFASGDSSCITLWELATARPRLRLPGHQGDVNCVTFSADGKRLLSGSTDTTALVWDLTAAGRPRERDRKGWDELWADLRSPDAAKAYPATCALAAGPGGVRFLKGRLRPTPAGDEARINRLIRELDSESFARREKATRELEKLGASAEGAFRKALAGKPSLEVHRRLTRLLGRYSAEWLRTQRAIEALELAGAPEARALLEELAKGAPGSRQTGEASGALERLAGR